MDNPMSLRDMEKYINDNFDDVLAIYDENSECIDVEEIGRVGSTEYIDCIRTQKDFEEFIKNKTK